MFRALLPGLALALGPPAVPLRAAELILPQNRTAFYCSEEIELAVAGLKKGEAVTIELVPAGKGLKPVALKVVGDGSTVAGILPANALAPALYTLRLEGKEAGKLTISSGVNVSPLLLSATVGNPKEAGANFLLGNAFGFGMLDHLGKPALDMRGRRSSGMQAFDNAVRDNLPTVVYMYWTGYVTHKPFGSEKSWAAARHGAGDAAAQLPHGPATSPISTSNIISVGTIDEPGLSLGQDAGRRHGARLPQLGREGLVRIARLEVHPGHRRHAPTPTG